MKKFRIIQTAILASFVSALIGCGSARGYPYDHTGASFSLILGPRVRNTSGQIPGWQLLLSQPAGLYLLARARQSFLPGSILFRQGPLQ